MVYFGIILSYRKVPNTVQRISIHPLIHSVSLLLTSYITRVRLSQLRTWCWNIINEIPDFLDFSSFSINVLFLFQDLTVHGTTLHMGVMSPSLSGLEQFLSLSVFLCLGQSGEGWPGPVGRPPIWVCPMFSHD